MREKLGHEGPLNLDGLKTRAPDDFSMALLDAWAVTGDVLTFYQERIANEGYLRCATERRSVLELARLTGYALRPGVAASVFLAYALEKDAAPVVIPKGARVNSVPGPGEQMEAFETSEPLQARVEWNELTPLDEPPGRPQSAQCHLHRTAALQGRRAQSGGQRRDAVRLWPRTWQPDPAPRRFHQARHRRRRNRDPAAAADRPARDHGRVERYRRPLCGPGMALPGQGQAGTDRRFRSAHGAQACAGRAHLRFRTVR
ncbi:hypothetical protein LP420_31550 [Massilia sp. B-10]|nr:hypothetical protein LP420_31550 [Massilia sp. B-10]